MGVKAVEGDEAEGSWIGDLDWRLQRASPEEVAEFRDLLGTLIRHPLYNEELSAVLPPHRQLYFANSHLEKRSKGDTVSWLGDYREELKLCSPGEVRSYLHLLMKLERTFHSEKEHVEAELRRHPLYERLYERFPLPSCIETVELCKYLGADYRAEEFVCLSDMGLLE
jgi:hypothetical protein